MKIKNSNIFVIILLAFLYYFSAEFRTQLIMYTGIVSNVVFPSEGIALAFAIHFGKRVWPGIFLGQFLIAYTNGLDITTSLSISTVNSLEAIIAVEFFKYLKLDEKLSSFRDIIALSLLIILILQPFSAIFSNTFLLFFGHITPEEFSNSTFSWWFGNVMGQFLFTPLLLTLFNYYKTIKIKDFLIFTILFTLYILTLIYIFHTTSSLLLLSLTLPFLIYIVYIRNTLYSLFLIVLMTYIFSFFMTIEIGPFSYHDNSVNIIDYNLYFLTLILTTITAKIIFENQKNQEERLQIMINAAVEENKEQQLFMLQQNRLAQMGEMIAMIAHQWRQPLNNLSLLNQLIISKYKKNKLDNKTMEYFQKNAHLHISLMSETIDDFKNFFKPQENPKKFNLNELILTVLNIIKPVLEKESVNIIFLTKEQYICSGYKNSLGHAIVNIVNNAKDALIEKNINNKKITIQLYEKEDNLIISIEDNAGGIPKDIINKIFDPYFSTKTEKNGTGLGLYMTNMIISEHMHSKIEVKNSDYGAIFNIILKGDIYERTT